MDPNELQGCCVLAAVLGSDASVEYVRGVAQCEATEVLVHGEDGSTYKVPNGLASSALRVDDAVRAAAPETYAPMLVGVAYMVLVPTVDGDWAIARTPGWKAHLPKGWKPPNDKSGK